jgi:glycosyltransferase involved in cell wall biosynthesis
MKKILVLTPRFPYPVIGGDRLRIYEMCKELSKNYSLTLLTLCESQYEMELSPPEDGVFSEIHRIFMPKYRSYISCMLALPSDTPLQVAYYKSAKFDKVLNELYKEHDLILSHLIRVADYVKKLSIPKVLEMTDAISMNYERVCETANKAGIKGIIYRLEKNRLNRYEKDIVKDFNLNILVSQFDKDYLFEPNSDGSRKTIVCSNGVDTSKLSYEFSPTSKELIFIGNMYSAQNLDAVTWFAEQVMPKLRKLGQYRFKVIGRIRPYDENKLNLIDGVIATGAVDNIDSYARGAIAGICSVRLAAGVQNKILEYMALGIPTITTSIGLEGLAALQDKDILIADTIEDYIKHIQELENNPSYAEMISLNAHEYVKKSHSWSGKLKPVISAIDGLLQ